MKNVEKGIRTGALRSALVAAACAVASVGASAVALSGSGSGGNIPDGSLAGVLSTIVMPDAGTVTSLSISVAVTHSWVGDLVYQLEHLGRVVTLLDRPGAPAGDASADGSDADLLAGAPLVFHAGATAAAESVGVGCFGPGTVGVSAGCLNTLFVPQQSLSLFAGAAVGGSWTLGVLDHYRGDAGVLAGWTVNADVTALPVPEPASGVLAAIGVAGLLLRRRFGR